MIGKRKADIIERRDGRIELRGAAYTKMKSKLRRRCTDGYTRR
jgi:hypothetical protein